MKKKNRNTQPWKYRVKVMLILENSRIHLLEIGISYSSINVVVYKLPRKFKFNINSNNNTCKREPITIIIIR